MERTALPLTASTRSLSRRRNWRAPGLLILLLLVTACAPMTREPEVGAADPGVAAARELSAAGQYDAAAEAYLDLARSATGPLRERYLIRAARQRLLAGRTAEARATLQQLPDPVSAENRLGWAQVAAEVALASDDARAALDALARAPATRKPAAAAELARLRGEALFRLGEPVAGTEAILEREVWLEDAEAIAANQRLLWSLFQNYGAGQPVPELPEDDSVLAGWLDLGQIAAAPAGGGTGLALALRNWQQRFPQHPARGTLVEELLASLGATTFLPDRVALLLPLSGRQAPAGTAIRDGFFAAYYAETAAEQRPLVAVYDTQADGPLYAHRRAVAEGAQIVVGPLLKSSVQALATAGEALGAPTLALNYLPDDIPAPPGLVQYALAPEDEAAEGAVRAIAQGLRRAIALVPNNDWGRRLLSSFSNTYAELGGVLISYRFYEDSASDFSYGIQDLLLISESRDRKTRLSTNLGMDLEFEPRRRADVDLIFLAAQPQAGKLLRPQLRFYYAGNIPTYATSAIFQEGSGSNTDLNGILFPDMPWVISPDAKHADTRASLARYWPGEVQRRSRLFAMGYDAFALASRLTSPGGFSALDGVTGQLYFGRDGRVHRRLAWARIANGRPRALDPTPTLRAVPTED